MGYIICFVSSKPQKSSYRVSNYLQYENNLNMTGIEFPVTIKKIFSFKNPLISINVFGLDQKNMIPFYLIHEKKRKSYKSSFARKKN